MILSSNLQIRVLHSDFKKKNLQRMSFTTTCMIILSYATPASEQVIFYFAIDSRYKFQYSIILIIQHK